MPTELSAATGRQQSCDAKHVKQAGPGTEPKPETGTVGTV